MSINREKIVAEILSLRHNGKIKFLYGPRRVGKTFLLERLLPDAIKKIDGEKNAIFFCSFEDYKNADLRSASSFLSYLGDNFSRHSQITLLLDEVFLVDEPFLLVEALLRETRFDVYLSSSFMMSKKLTVREKRVFARLQRVYIPPLWPLETFKQFGAKEENDFCECGSLPGNLERKGVAEKRSYLEKMINVAYLPDIIAREHLGDYSKRFLTRIMGLLALNAGEFLNANTLASLYEDVYQRGIDPKTVETYLGYLGNAFIVERISKYSVKERKEVGGHYKFYFFDAGIRNAANGFHYCFDAAAFECLLYNLLKGKGYALKVGYYYSFYTNEHGKRSRLPQYVDFVATKKDVSFYLQCRFSRFDDKEEEEKRRILRKIPNSFKKIVVYNEAKDVSYDEDGILSLSIFEFVKDADKILS